MEHRVFIIQEIGINANGDLALAKRLIQGAAWAGVDAVKFQKRSVDIVYPADVLASRRDSPWGSTTREQKVGLEFGPAEYDAIDEYCRVVGVPWFASAWDLDSQRFLQRYDCPYNKIASPMLRYTPLLEMVASERKQTYISTGMSTMADIQAAVDIFVRHNCPYAVMHCTSTYPLAPKDANLRMIPALRGRFGCDVGYSAHDDGQALSLAAVALGATSIERHVTLDPSMYGSDQRASIDLPRLYFMIQAIRKLEVALGTGEKCVLAQEEQIAKKLRWYE